MKGLLLRSEFRACKLQCLRQIEQISNEMWKHSVNSSVVGESLLETDNGGSRAKRDQWGLLC